MVDKLRFTLRDLPFPAKLVITTFLISVGLGYLWGLVQMHFKHAGKGDLMPSLTDTVEQFSGQQAPWNKNDVPAAENKQNVQKPEGKPVAAAKIKSIINARCVDCHGKDGDKEEVPLDSFANISKLLDTPPEKGKIHKAIAKEDDAKFNKDNMSQAFTKRSTVKVDGEELNWKDFVKNHKDKEPAVRAERETERLALKAWLEAGAPEEVYTNDAFPLPEELRTEKLTADFRTEAPEIRKEQMAGMAAAKKKKNPKDRQLSVESLTQSTHAHLLSFSMLWALTGLAFAFTSYPRWMRVCLSPLVLVAQVADISFWWLARLPDVGPCFAVAIFGTGALVGIGLSLQIVLSMFNMYGGKGKLVLAFICLLGIGGLGVVYIKCIEPEVATEKQDAAPKQP
jgi:hypothetical protein